MLQLQKYTHGLAVTRRSFPIWREVTIDLPIQSSGNVIKGTAMVDFTNLVSAKAVISVIAYVWPSWASLTLNGSEIAAFDFRLGGGASSLEVDVTSKIVKGANEFLFYAKKVGWVGWGTYTVTVDLVIEAETSTVQPPAPWETWPSWWPYATAGIGMAAVGGIILVRRKK